MSQGNACLHTNQAKVAAVDHGGVLLHLDLPLPPDVAVADGDVALGGLDDLWGSRGPSWDRAIIFSSCRTRLVYLPSLALTS